MDMRAALTDVVYPGLALLPPLPGVNSLGACMQLLTTGGQESNWTERQQLVGKPPAPTGPAKSFYQFERGGIRGVMRHAASATKLRAVCEARSVPFDDLAIWNAIRDDDALATALARLLLWTDAFAMPKVGDVDAAWQLYLRTWNPGAWARGTPAQRAELRAKWGRKYAEALQVL